MTHQTSSHAIVKLLLTNCSSPMPCSHSYYTETFQDNYMPFSLACVTLVMERNTYKDSGRISKLFKWFGLFTVISEIIQRDTFSSKFKLNDHNKCLLENVGKRHSLLVSVGMKSLQFLPLVAG